MEEHQLTRSNQFTPPDLAAIAGFNHALTILRSVLEGDLRERFRLVCGSVTDDYDTCVRVVRGSALSLRTSPKNRLSVDLGFWLPGGDGYPGALGQIACEFKNRGNEKIVEAMLQFAAGKPDTWIVEKVSMVSDWGRIMRYRSVASFLGEPDHVIAAQRFFGEVLDDIAEFRAAFADLKWDE